MMAAAKSKGASSGKNVKPMLPIGVRGPGRPPKEGVERVGDRISRAKPVPPEKAEAARRTVAQARCRAMGWPDGHDWRDLAMAEHLGCEAGRAIHDLPAGDRAALWETIKMVRRVYTRYWAIHGLPMPYPDALSLAMLPEQVTSDNVNEQAIYDDRTIEEKSRAATTAMMRVEAVLMTYRVASMVKSAVLRDEPIKDRAALVLALLVLAKKTESDA